MRNNLKAFIKYGADGRVLSSTLVLRTKKPSGAGWEEINLTQCCSGEENEIRRSPDGFRAYVKYDSHGRVLPSTLLIRRRKPNGKGWKEVSIVKCCGTVVPE